MPNQKATKVTTELPVIMEFQDYHLIPDTCDILNTIIVERIHSCEIHANDYGFEFNSKYLGLFWIRGEPSTEEIIEMLKELRDSFNEKFLIRIDNTIKIEKAKAVTKEREI